MTFTSPFTAVPGEIITAAGWNTSGRDNINHIWGVIGGNPGSSNKVPVSNGASSSVWGLLPDAALADQKVSQVNVNVSDLDSSIPSGFYEALTPAADAHSPTGNSNWYVQSFRLVANSAYRFQIAYNVHSTDMYIRSILAGVGQPWRRVWTSGVMGTGSGLDADSVRTYVPGNASGTIAIANGTVVVNLNAQILQGLVPANGSGNIPISNGTVNTNLNAAMLLGLAAGNGTGQIPISNGTVNTNLNAAMLNGFGWPAPVTINATSNNVFMPAGYTDVNGLTYTAPRTGKYLVFMHLEGLFQGQILQGWPQMACRAQRTGSGTVNTRDSSLQHVVQYPAFCGSGMFEIDAVAGDTIKAQITDYTNSGQDTIYTGCYMTISWIGQ